jgi:hypothetical protein
MAGKQIRVSDGFATYLTFTQRKIKNETGVKLSTAKITDILVMHTPIIKLEMNGKRRKIGNLFDL